MKSVGKIKKCMLDIDQILAGSKCPFPIEVIPNNMGINLCAVGSIWWEEMPDGQLVRVTINFIPEIKEGE